MHTILIATKYLRLPPSMIAITYDHASRACSPGAQALLKLQAAARARIAKRAAAERRRATDAIQRQARRRKEQDRSMPPRLARPATTPTLFCREVQLIATDAHPEGV